MPITLTLKRAAEESGLSVRTLYNRIGSGELATVLVGRRRLVPSKALEEFLLRGTKSQIPKGAPTAVDGLKQVKLREPRPAREK